jgi:hypothetical protein
MSDPASEALNAELEPLRRERIIMLTALDAAISSGKATATKILLRKLHSLGRRERAIVRSNASP